MQIKGTAIRSALQALAQLHGADAVARVRAALPSDVGEELDRVIATKSYPAELAAALQTAIRDVVGGGDCAVNYRLGIEAARIDFGGIYRIFLRIADYETSLRRLARAWQQYNSHGEVSWRILERSHGQCVVEGTEGFNTPMWWSIAGRVVGILRLAGAPQADAEVVSCSPQSCTVDVRWTR